MTTYFEALEEVSKLLAESFRELEKAVGVLFNVLMDKWNEIKEFAEQYEVKRTEREYIRNSWVVPAKIAFNSQVLNRKPVMCRARSNC